MEIITTFLFIVSWFATFYYTFAWITFLIINIKVKRWIAQPKWWANLAGILSIIYFITFLLLI